PWRAISDTLDKWRLAGLGGLIERARMTLSGSEPVLVPPAADKQARVGRPPDRASVRFTATITSHLLIRIDQMQLPLLRTLVERFPLGGATDPKQAIRRVRTPRQAVCCHSGRILPICTDAVRISSKRYSRVLSPATCRSNRPRGS